MIGELAIRLRELQTKSDFPFQAETFVLENPVELKNFTKVGKAESSQWSSPRRSRLRAGAGQTV